MLRIKAAQYVIYIDLNTYIFEKLNPVVKIKLFKNQISVTEIHF